MAKYTADYLVDIRSTLQDTNALDYRWTDVELTAHLNHALMEASTIVPAEKLSTALTTTIDSREIDISTLTDLIGYIKLEWPTGYYPPKYKEIVRNFGGKILFDSANAPTAADATKIYYRGMHSVGVAASTVPPVIEWHIIQIAAILAMIGFTKHGRNAIALGIAKIVTAGEALSLVTDLVADAMQTLDDAKAMTGEHNQDAEDRIAMMDAPLNAAIDDLDAGRSVISDSVTDIDDALAGSEERITKAVEFLETYGHHFINKTNYGNNVPGYYSQYANTELGASNQWIAQAHALLARDGQSNEWFKAVGAGIQVAMAQISAAQGHLAMNQAGRDMTAIAYGELQMALSNIQESQANLSAAQANLSVAKVLESYENRAQYQLSVVKADLNRFRPDHRVETYARS